MEVELIKAHDSFDGSARRKIERLRVAAYCRVSTDDEDQIKSYNSMVTHYTELIKNNKEWIFLSFNIRTYFNVSRVFLANRGRLLAIIISILPSMQS